MKTLKKITAVFSIILLFAVFPSCQSNTDVSQVLSKPETRMAVMESIANNSDMSKEMFELMMKNNNGKMMMQGSGNMMNKMMGMMMDDQDEMIKMMKGNPAFIQNMMNYMMNASKGNEEMMSAMLNTMMKDPQMTNMMQNMMKSGNNMMGMEKMEGMDPSENEKK